MTMELAPSHVLCPVHWLHVYLLPEGIPTEADDHPVCILEKHSQSVSIAKGTTGVLGKLLIKHLIHCYAGESTQSCRCGRAINDIADGASGNAIVASSFSIPLLSTAAMHAKEKLPRMP